jgi:phosphoribosylformylglycinamidine synthase
MGEVAEALKIPIPSGNVSFYNETPHASVLPTPTILACGIVRDIRKCVTSDLKNEGGTLALIGTTGREMGGSEYYRMTKSHSSLVPDVDVGVLRAGMEVVIGGIERSAIVSCHDISDGGLAVALAEMCIGGDFGAEIELPRREGLRTDTRLFSESTSRWLVELRKGKEKQLPKDRRIKVTRLGQVGGSSLTIRSGKKVIDTDVDKLAKSFNEPLWKVMG